MKFEKEPENRYRALPFWSLNGKLNREELINQIKILKQMGFGGAFIHSRTGLATEYMGEDWLSLVKDCSTAFKSEGMDAWLYDEDRWPSGTCGGYVTENPKFRARYLSAHIMPREKLDLREYRTEFVAAYAIKLCGNEYSRYTENMPKFSGMALEDYFKIDNAFSVPNDYMAMVFTEEIMDGEEFYNGYTYINTLSPEPTEKFIELTHEKYKAAMGNMFGGEIKGIFTDEPHRGALLNGFVITNKNRLYMLPYTDKLFAEYKKRWNEELSDKLPELYFSVGEDNFSRTMWRYVEVLQELFLTNFAKPINEWCKKNNLILTGHVLHEDTLAAQTTLSGSVMRYYEHMQYPGLDNLGPDNTCFPAAIAVNSVAKQTGKKYVLSELYGCTGWKSTFEDYKRIGDWQAALGVNLRCPHLSWYTMKGEAKRDYPASIGKQANWRKEYRAVEDYFARLNKVLSESKPLTQTLVITPVESAWGLSHLGTYVNSFGVRCEEYQKLEDSFFGLTKSLLYAGVDFDYGDEEMMSRMSAVGKDEHGAYIKVGKMTYREVILPYAVNMRSSTFSLLTKFAMAGGKVAVCERFPRYLDGNKADIKIDGATVLPQDKIPSAATRGIAHVESDGNFFGTVKRCGKDEYVYFAVNADREKSYAAKIVFEGEYNVEKFDLRTGETVGVNYLHEGANTIVEHSFDKSEEILLHFTRKKVIAAAPKTDAKQTEIDNKTPLKYKLGAPNALVLDRAKCYVDGEFFAEEELLRLDRMLRQKFSLNLRGGTMIQPWFKEKFLPEYENTVCRVTFEFAFGVEYIPADVRIMAESRDKLTLKLNGNLLPAGGEPTDIDECYTYVPVSSEFFKVGANVLTAEFDFGDSVDIENLFLFGSFGVKAGNPCTVIPLPEYITLGDLCTQGFPFYAGDVTYVIPAENGFCDITVTDFFAACLKADGKVYAAAPYNVRVKAVGGAAEITAVLTPKNLFGPLHELPANTPFCGPEDFHTAQLQWTDDYSLIPQGIFKIKM